MKLPSGREIELRPLNYGDIRDAEDAQIASGSRGVAVYYQRLVQAVSGLSVEELRSLTPLDGRALESAARAAEEGRPAEAEAPFVTDSSSVSETTPA